MYDGNISAPPHSLWGSTEKGKMLIVLQFSFADLRMFAPKMGGKTRIPTWAKSNLSGFVRGFGQIEDRYKGLGSPHQRKLYKIDKAERYYVNATRSIFPKRRGCFVVGDDLIHQHVFSRLISDGYFTTRVEIGFHINESREGPFDEKFIDSLITELLELPLHFRNRSPNRCKSYRSEDVGKLRSAVQQLRNRLYQKTTLMGTSGNIHVTDFMDFLGLLVFVDFGESGASRVFLESSQITRQSDTGFDISFIEKHLGGCPISLWVTGSCRKGHSDRMRRARLHILRMAPEIRALEAAVNFLSDLQFRVQVPPELREAFVARVSSSIDRLAETAHSLSGDVGTLHVGTMASGEAMSEVVENIKATYNEVSPQSSQWFGQRMDAIGRDAGLPVSRNPEFSLDAGRDIIITMAKQGDISMTSKNYSAKNVGVQGDGNKVRDVSVNVDQTWNEITREQEIDFSALKEELNRLQAALNAEAATSSEVDEAANVKKAELAAASGDKNGILEALGAVGKWTLGVAEKIAVPTAIAFLKKLVLP